ncbi:MAG: DUF1415 family protein [Polyangiaceae bacterium]|nr:DUF1415 family protein [Polyangiaceae bacterium]
MSRGYDDRVRDEPGFIAEVLRVHARFNAEIIEGLNVCPYAGPARAQGASVRRVSLSTDVSATLHEIEAELAPREEIEVAQIVFPLVTLGAAEFSRMGSAHAEERSARSARRPIFVHAAFHPELPYGIDTPSRLVPLFRRAPDPMIQLIRLAVLDAVHRSRPRGSQFFSGGPEELARLLAAPRPESVTDRITRENHERATAGGHEDVLAILADIAADRARAYAPFLQDEGR